jgi:hypothetical protein
MLIFSLGRQFMVDNRLGDCGSNAISLIPQAVPANQEGLQTLAIFWQGLLQWTSVSRNSRNDENRTATVNLCGCKRDGGYP